MTVRFLMGSTAALALASSAAFADVTPADVWQLWQSQANLSGGATISATQTAQGDDLRLSELTVVSKAGEAAVKMTLPDVTLQADAGKVNVVLPTAFDVLLEVDGPGSDEDVSMTVKMSSADLKAVVSGTPDAIVQRSTARMLTILLDDLPNSADEQVEGSIEMQLTDFVGSSTTLVGEQTDVSYEYTAKKIGADVDISEKGSSENHFTIDFAADNLTMAGNGILAMMATAGELPALLGAGTQITGSYSYENAMFDLAGTEDGESFNAKVKLDDGQLNVAVDKTGVAYDAAAKGLAIDVTGSEIPLPIEATLADYGFGLKVPAVASDDAQDIALRLRLGDLAISEVLWAILDPQKIMPRDPASLVLDFSGKAKSFVSLFDAEQMENLDGAPGELEQVSINELLVQAAGAMITGKGAFTFDNSDLETFDGMPRPEGSVDFRVKGANGLIDRLIKMGLISNEDAMGGRMMMGMFTQAVGDDELTSNITVNKQGHVLANGQRLR